MSDDPRFRNPRVLARSVGAAETTRLTRGESVLADIVGPGQIDDFYRSFSFRCGEALPTAMVQLLDFMESRCNSSARVRDPQMHAMVKAWRQPGVMDSIYLNACVEEYARDKAWAQTTDAQRERAISLARFGEKLTEESSTGAMDKTKEIGVGVLLATGLSFATDSMALVDKLPEGMRKSIEEAAKAGAEALSTLHDFSPHALATVAIGVGVAAALVAGKSLLKASWTAATEQRKRVSVSYEIPRSLAILDRDHAWEPHILGIPELSHGLHVKPALAVWESDSFEVLSGNRHAIRGHAAQVAVEIKQAWSLLTNEQKEAAKDMPAPEAISIAASAISGMRQRAGLRGYGSLDYASLDMGERQSIARHAFERIHHHHGPSPKPLASIDPSGVKAKLLSRRPSLGSSSAPAPAAP